ncbi:MAG: glycosyltransferase family 25 protein [Hyphomicrobiaceae bacterium]
MQRPLATSVINLDRDADRLRSVKAQFDALPEFILQRIPGVLAADLPHAACTHLAGKLGAKRRGMLGCFLAHVSAWEVAAESDEPAHLIIEDDIQLVHPEALFRADLPEDTDIVFCNSRMNPNPDVARREAPLVLPARAALAVKAAIGASGRNWVGVGADGYMLTKAGASKLIAAVMRDGFWGHVDARMLRYCLAPDDVRSAAPDGSLDFWQIMDPASHPKLPWGILNGYCLSPHVVKPNSAFSPATSARRALDQGRSL